MERPRYPQLTGAIKGSTRRATYESICTPGIGISTHVYLQTLVARLLGRPGARCTTRAAVTAAVEIPCDAGCVVDQPRIPWPSTDLVVVPMHGLPAALRTQLPEVRIPAYMFGFEADTEASVTTAPNADELVVFAHAGFDVLCLDPATGYVDMVVDRDQTIVRGQSMVNSSLAQSVATVIESHPPLPAPQRRSRDGPVHRRRERVARKAGDHRPASVGDRRLQGRAPLGHRDV
jgi:hypothetical protein